MAVEGSLSSRRNFLREEESHDCCTASARSTVRPPISPVKCSQDEVLVGQTPSRMRATVVSFTPGARTGWHAHPVGQTLYCLSGVGRICIGKGSRPQAIYPATR